MLTKRFTISCSEIATRIKEIKTKKVEFDGVEKTDIPKALMLKKEIQTSIQRLKEQLKPVVTIEGKEFPVFQLEIGGKTAKELEDELISKNIKISNDAKEILHSSGFVTSPTVEQVDLVRLKISDLGFPNGVTTNELYIKALEWGLDLCPAEVGPYQRLKDEQQALNDWYLIAAEQIAARYGYQYVLSIEHRDDGLWLRGVCSESGRRREWNTSDEFVFRIPSK